MWPSRQLQLCIICIVVSCSRCEAFGHHENTRGLRTVGLSHEQVKDMEKQHHINLQYGRDIHKAARAEHPELKRFHDWHHKVQQEGQHTQHGAAFAGKIPQEFWHHLMTGKAVHAPAADTYMSATGGASSDLPQMTHPELGRQEL